MAHAFTCDRCGKPFIGKPASSFIDGKLRDAVAKINMGEEVALKEYCANCTALHSDIDSK